MGANAVTTVYDFTAGEVLTAAQMDNVNCGIPVFATTTTRDAAFGGTGEKTLAEGQFAYIEASDTTQYYDGSAWQTVSATPGMRLVAGAAFTAVSSFSLPTNTFTSTYRNYRVMVEVSDMSTSMTITARLRAAGADNSTSNYIFEQFGWSTDSATVSTQGTSQTSWTMSVLDTTNYRYGNLVFDLVTPQLAQRTTLVGSSIGPGAGGFPNRWGQNIMGAIFTGTTQFDSMSFICNTGNMTGVYRIYGYSES